MNESLTTKIISRFTIGLVILLATGGFVLSYHALHNVALKNGIPAWAAWVWPLLIDVALVIFSLAVLRAYLKNDRARWAWSMVGVFTLGTIVFNLVHAGGDVTELIVWGWTIEIKYIVGLVAPLALFFGLESALGMVRREVKQAKTTRNLEKLVILEAERQESLDKLNTQIETGQAKLMEIQTEIKTKREQLATAGRQAVVIVGAEPDKLKNKPAERQALLGQMIGQLRSDGLPDSDIQQLAIETFNISAKTYERDVKALNGQLN